MTHPIIAVYRLEDEHDFECIPEIESCDCKAIFSLVTPISHDYYCENHIVPALHDLVHTLALSIRLTKSGLTFKSGKISFPKPQKETL